MVSVASNGGANGLGSRSRLHFNNHNHNHNQSHDNNYFNANNSLALRLIWGWFVFVFGLFNWFVLLLRPIKSGAFFKRSSEKEENDFTIARDTYWNLSKQPVPGFHHDFYKTRTGFQFHYLTNRPQPVLGKDLIILIHGFPNSCMVWRSLLQEPALPKNNATIVAVDLPGYGGSDSLPKYDTQVLEHVSEFIVAMRDQYGISGDSVGSTFVVGHDWGCVVALRLAAEAPCLADRFILTNGPLIDLVRANIERSLSSSRSIFRQFRASPRRNFGCLAKSFQAIKPVLLQLLFSGYIFAFNLPIYLVKTLGQSGNLAILKGSSTLEHATSREEYKRHESMASNLGPSLAECKTLTKSGSTYGSSVGERVKTAGEVFWHMTGYYRHGLAMDPWEKSIEVIAALYNLDSDLSSSESPSRRRSSSASSALFSDQHKGCLRAPITMIWGEADIALTKAVCLDGIGDYLFRDSEVFLLPQAGHWVPVGKSSRQAMAQIIGIFANGDSKQTPSYIAKQVESLGIDATLVAKK